MMNLIGGALMRMFKPGRIALKRVHPKGMSEAVAQEIHQGEADVLLEGNLVLHLLILCQILIFHILRELWLLFNAQLVTVSILLW